MAELIYDEAQLFLLCLLLGMFFALIYDGIRILRLLFHHWNWVMDFENLMYWMIVAWMVFCTLFRYNQGVLRGYAFVGMLIGVVLYVMTVSRFILNGVHWILPHWNTFKNWLKRPLSYVVKTFRKALKNIISDVTMAVKGR